MPDPALPRQLLNFDLAENSLGALERAAHGFAFRPGARRAVLLMTDGSFLEPPWTFSDGTAARHSYADVLSALKRRELRLFSVHAGSNGRGLSARHGGHPSRVEATGGSWFELADVASGALDLDELLVDLVLAPACR